MQPAPPQTNLDKVGENCLTSKVVGVQVADNVSMLDTKYSDRQNYSQMLDENGKIQPLTLYYVKYGDGVDAPQQEVIDTKQVQPVLVYVTLEYTNISDVELAEIVYMANIVKLYEKDGVYRLNQDDPWNGYSEQPLSDEWDAVVDPNGFLNPEMMYYDVRGGEAGNNYISNLKPGESRTVNIAFFVDKSELPYLYLNVSPYGGSDSFTDETIKTGLVDIRQSAVN